MINKDELLKKVGNFGFFQKKAIFALLSVAYCCNSIVVLCSVFVVYTPPHRCFIPELDEHNTSSIQYTLPSVPQVLTNESIAKSAIELSRYIPIEKGSDGKLRWSQCHRYLNATSKNFQQISNHSEVISCDAGWRFFSSRNVFTASMEFDLVCDQAWLAPLASSMIFGGFILGAIAGGYSADRFGRRFTITSSALVLFLCSGLIALLPMWQATYFAWFIMGVMGVSSAGTGIVMINEMTPTKHRYKACFFNMVASSSGYMSMPLFAYLIPHWRYLMAAAATTQLISLLLVICFVKESLAWLLQNGKQDKATELIRHIGDVNKKRLRSHEDLLIEVEDKKADLIDKKKSGGGRRLSYLNFISVSFLRKRMFILTLAWIAASVGYYGLSVNTNNLGGDRYLACFLSGAMEIPANVFSYFGLKKLGGRISFMIMTGLSGLCLLATPPLLLVSQTAVIVCNLIGKLFISTAYFMLYVFVGDFFPTLLRNQSYGASSVSSRILTMLVPFLMYLGENYQQSTPYFVIGGIAIMSTAAMVFLPETRNTPLPDSMEDARKQEESAMQCCDVFRKKKNSMEDHDIST